jgi:hypothetical protein
MSPPPPPARGPLNRPAVDGAVNPDVGVGDRVFRQVAEVVGWVAAGAEANKPEPGPVVTKVVQPRVERVLTKEPSEPDAADVSVSVGSIEVSVEAPNAPAPVASAKLPSPAPAAEPAPVASGIGLTRYYLRS